LTQRPLVKTHSTPTASARQVTETAVVSAAFGQSIMGEIAEFMVARTQQMKINIGEIERFVEKLKAERRPTRRFVWCERHERPVKIDRRKKRPRH
jgi:hypothetical protein